MKKGHLLLTALFFLSAITMSSCKKDDGNEPSTCSNGILDGDETDIDCGGSCSACSSSNKTYYFKGTVDGDQITNEDNSVTPTASRSSFGGFCTYGLGGMITADDIFGTVNNAFSLQFNNIYQGNCPSIDDTSIYNHLFTADVYTFASGPSGSSISLSLLINGTDYNTGNFGAQPSTSNFTIVQSTPIAPFNGDDAVKIKATFTCKLQSDNGDVIDVTNGETTIAIYDYD